MTAITAIILAFLAISNVISTASAYDDYADDDYNRAPSDPVKVAERMAKDYTAALDTLVGLIQQPITLPSSPSHKDDSVETMLLEGKTAFETALRVFPDESLPHAHLLFAKVCTKVGAYQESLPLFDEAIRRASMPLENGTTNMGGGASSPSSSADARARAEASSLVQQLVLERSRSHFLLLENEVSKWDDVNIQLHRGGIAPGTSPLMPLVSVEKQLEIFPKHSQALHNKASFLVLSLDGAPPENANGTNSTVASTRSWEAYDTFRKSQVTGYEAYTYGKNQHLAGGKSCINRANNKDYAGLVVGGSAWSNAPGASSTPFSYNNKTKTTVGDENDDDLYIGIITLQNIVISGRDAVISGHGSDCHVYVPHPYVNLANNLPMVTSWETDAMMMAGQEGLLLPLLTYVPEGNNNAYGGKITKDPVNGNDDLMIPDPKLSAQRGRFHSALLLTGYASYNYFHFVTETLPSLVATRKYVRSVLEKGDANHVVIIPNLQYEFVEGFVRLLLPEAFSEDDDEGNNGENKLSPQMVQWGPNKRRNNSDEGDEHVKFDSSHPIAHVRRLVAVAWDQPFRAPPPVGGPPHCLTPAPLLRAMRRAVWNAVNALRGVDETINRKLKVVYCSRSTSPTRSLMEEEELLLRIKDEIREEGLHAEVILFEKKTDENGKSRFPLEFIMDTIRLFQSADVVVGVHGASLANIAFANVGTTIVEMGLEGLSQASHYRHLSQALDLHHVDVFLAKDARSLGAAGVTLREGELESVVEAVVGGLKIRKGGEIGNHSEL
mmetsp:Transcript_12482/g.23775  ORF Transcript_12482/g.23775 Transcript_12482/m.23775 type:complete len:780 (-) Transcript_12482:235-2574(-)